MFLYESWETTLNDERRKFYLVFFFCLGMRFALMEAKVALVKLLKDFVFIPSKKTQVPIALDKSSGLLKAKDGVWVRLANRVEA